MTEEEMTDKIFNEIKGYVAKLNELQKVQFHIVKNKVNNIMKNNIKDSNLIGHTFDELLDLAWFYGDGVYELYYKFLAYYRKIDKEAADDYERFYLEILDEEENGYDSYENKEC